MNSHPAEELSAYVSGELASEERIRVEQHLSVCADCRKELSRLRNLNEVLSSTESLEPSSDFVAGVLRRLDRNRSVIVFKKRKILAMAAVAAAIVLFVLSLTFQSEVHPPPAIVHTVIKPDTSAPKAQPAGSPDLPLNQQDADLIANLDLLESMDAIQDYDSVENMEYAMIGDSGEIAE